MFGSFGKSTTNTFQKFCIFVGNGKICSLGDHLVAEDQGLVQFPLDVTIKRETNTAILKCCRTCIT